MHVEHLSFEYGDKQILKDVSFVIPQGDKVGLVGANGAGKTTFLKIIMGMLDPTCGSIILKKGTTIGWLPQIIAESDEEKEMTVEDYILSARPIASLEKEINSIYEKIGQAVSEQEQERLIKEAAKIQERLEELDWYEYTSIMLSIAYNMKITDEMLKKRVKELSGGQKSKVAFAKLLYGRQDILLLDEPTNHLDSETKRYVTDFLKTYKGTVLVISHDVAFLNEITNVTLFFDIRTQKVIRYPGNYSVFEKLHEEYEMRLETEARKQTEEIERLQRVIGKLDGTSGKRKRMAEDREKKLDKIMQERIVVAPQRSSVEFEMKQDREENKIPVSVKKINFRYTEIGKTVISNLSFEVAKGERFLVVGENGAGKSTLLKLISGVLTPVSGIITLGTKVDLGYYTQEHEGLELDKTILQNFATMDISEKNLRKRLAHFLFYGDDVHKLVSVLSPGERARVALAKLAMSGSNTILLDEPTNHLDPETQEIIARVFKDFTGTIIVVSHNPNFVDELGIERMLILPEGRIVDYNRGTVEKFNKLNNKKVKKK